MDKNVLLSRWIEYCWLNSQDTDYSDLQMWKTEIKNIEMITEGKNNTTQT